MKYSSSITLLLAAAAGWTISTVEAGGFRNTCKSWKIVDGYVLRACCLNAQGNYRISEKHLGHCLTNNAGWLEKKEEGNFDKSCNSCSLDSGPASVLTCKCDFPSNGGTGWLYSNYDNLVSSPSWSRRPKLLDDVSAHYTARHG
jgi:hypothetical protein